MDASLVASAERTRKAGKAGSDQKNLLFLKRKSPKSAPNIGLGRPFRA